MILKVFCVEFLLTVKFFTSSSASLLKIILLLELLFVIFDKILRDFSSILFSSFFVLLSPNILLIILSIFDESISCLLIFFSYSFSFFILFSYNFELVSNSL